MSFPHKLAWDATHQKGVVCIQPAIHVFGGRPMRLAGSTPGELAHICACFNNSEEAYRVLQPFVNQGLDRAEKAVRTIDPRRCAEQLRQPTWAEILVAALHKIHQFELRDWSETHLRDGQLEHLKTLALFGKIVKDAKEKGFPLIRFVTQMEWA